MAADRQTETHTQTRVTTIHFASSTTHAKCNNATLFFRGIDFSDSVYCRPNCRAKTLAEDKLAIVGDRWHDRNRKAIAHAQWPPSNSGAAGIYINYTNTRRSWCGL